MRALKQGSRGVGVALAAAVLFTSLGAGADDTGDDRFLDHTARVLRGGEIAVGLFAVDAGIAGRLMLGTDTVPWAAHLFLPIVMPNAHAKVVVWRSLATTVALQVGVYGAHVFDDRVESGASLLAVPLSLLGSFDVSPDLSVHIEGAYTYVGATATIGAQDLTADGGAVAGRAQVGLLLEYRVSRVTAMTLRGRYEPFVQPVTLHGSSQLDPWTVATIEASVRPAAPHPWVAIGGVAFSWRHVNLLLGVGYGYVFIPSLGVALPLRSVVPDGDFLVRF